MPKQKHVHTYKKKALGKNGTYIVYACIEPNCTHYLIPALLEGKTAKCPRCGQLYIMDKSALSLAFPHCPACTVKKTSLGLEQNAN